MASEMHPTPVASPTRQRVAAWIALALALIVPLTVAVNALTTLARIPGAGKRYRRWVALHHLPLF